MKIYLYGFKGTQKWGKNNSTGSKLKLIRVKKTLVRFVILMVEYEVLYQIFLHVTVSSYFVEFCIKNKSFRAKKGTDLGKMHVNNSVRSCGPNHCTKLAKLCLHHRQPLVILRIRQILCE